MLYVDEQAGAVRRERHAGDFTHVRIGEKTLDLACGGVAHQHLVIANALELALVQLPGMHIGLNPQQTAGPDAQTVRATKKIALDVASGLFALIGRIACQQQMVPNKGVARKGVLITPANDVTHGVVGARVRCIHAWVFVLATVGVVGQGAVHPAVVTVDGQPFRAVHFGGTQGVAGLPGFDQHLCLIGKPIGRCERTAAVHQWQPPSGAVGIEPRDIQRAMV